MPAEVPFLPECPPNPEVLAELSAFETTLLPPDPQLDPDSNDEPDPWDEEDTCKVPGGAYSELIELISLSALPE